MGAYITKSNVEGVFGRANIVKWSNLGNTQAPANEDRITAAITYAEAHINDRFRGGRYAIPFAGTIPQAVQDWAAKLAGAWLYESRGVSDGNDEGNKLTDMREDVTRDINAYVTGQRRLDATPSRTAPSAPIVVG